MLNVKDLDRYNAEINAVIDASGADSDKAMDIIAEYTGPETGLWWNQGDRKLCIAKGWCEDEDGNIVDPVECTGPATGLEYRNGKVRRVKQ